MKNKHDIHGGNPRGESATLGVPLPESAPLDFSVNLNPLGPPPNVAAIISSFSAKDAVPYPEPAATTAAAEIATARSVPLEEVLVGSGATEIFQWIVKVFAKSNATAVAPCYSGYAEVCAVEGVPFKHILHAKRENQFAIDWNKIDFSNSGLVFLASPNNPTGTASPPEKTLELVEKHLDTFFVIDESFVDFIPHNASLFNIPKLPPNCAVVQSLTKFFSIAGLRLGVVRTPRAAEIAKKRLPWTLNSLAAKVAGALYDDREFVAESKRRVAELRDSLSAEIATIPDIHPFPSATNFILCELTGDTKGAELARCLLERGIMIRRCSDWPGLGDDFIRIGVKTEPDNEILLDNLSDILGGEKRPTHSPKTAKTKIMVVGTSSGAGKSVLAAGICRLLARNGVKTAPFKAQNMSLNSFVTPEGGEIGRAQAAQAQAAGIEPHTDMNPILLKPEGDNRSQLVVNGKATISTSAKEYYSMKNDLGEIAKNAFDRLAGRFDAIVLEGAGSPAEINLMDKDFVNMAMAEHADAKTILVADIDRGGVFASILGTVALLPPRHRKLLTGVVINKFRGDPSLLDPGIDEIEKLTGVPILGILPHLGTLPIDEEDSLDLNSRGGHADANTPKIAVVKLPRISNFTDFAPLARHSAIRLEYAATPAGIRDADLILLPGTKNSIEDLEWLRQTELAAEIAAAVERGVPVIGICGGFQMLGAEINDPDGVEGPPGRRVEGLGLLPVKTTLRGTKQLTRMTGVTTEAFPFAPKGTPFEGYEIHVGETTPIKANTSIPSPLAITLKDKTPIDKLEGAISADGLVLGTYVHGLFDSPALVDAIAKWLTRNTKARPPRQDHSEPQSLEADKLAALDKLADLLEPMLRKPSPPDGAPIIPAQGRGE